MPDPHRIKRELEEILSRPHYSNLFYRRNQFRKPGSSPESPATVATGISAYLAASHALLDPVFVEEWRGPVQLYRVHDGRSGKYQDPINPSKSRYTAGTLGACWVERSVVDSMWTAAASTADPRKMFLEFMRSGNFVLPEWNHMTAICRLAIPAGGFVVVVRGKGNWQAMLTPAGGNRPDGKTAISNSGDVMTHLRMMPIPGTPQCVVPLVDDMLVENIPTNSGSYPFAP
ncbi:hypothetical protein ACFPT7_06455 [Acidicapsa dinghuensis]|uniref:Uncharacterized protein n=1 Tax=Acidicapsa dinghuensis TaxID=2218256 RepID=A0ABW1EG11_9BACT|nr:hypothetical protein [Acidicapsa dinghuensis]